MKSIAFIFLLILFSCQKKETKREIAISFKSINEQVEALKKYYQGSLHSQGEMKQMNERLFFEAFPNSFRNMEELFGFDEEKGACPLYDQEAGTRSGGIINYFYNLSSIDKVDYYNKYINICIDGVWEADNIVNGFGLYNKLYYFPSEVINVLKLRPEKEIRSVLKFCIDSPNPSISGSVEKYKGLHSKLKSVDPKIAELLKQEYEQLLSESKY